MLFDCITPPTFNHTIPTPIPVASGVALATEFTDYTSTIDAVFSTRPIMPNWYTSVSWGIDEGNLGTLPDPNNWWNVTSEWEGDRALPALDNLGLGELPTFGGFDFIIPAIDRSARPSHPTDVPPSFVYPETPQDPGDPPTISIDTVPTNETVRPTFNLNRPEPPFDAVRPTLSFPAMPGYDIVRPDFVYPADPNPIDLSALPTSPTLADPVLPADFTYDVPVAPTLSVVTLPTRPDITFPTFDATFTGTLGDYDGETLAWSETPYGSTLLTNIQDRLNYFLTTTSTGLSDEFWDALWARALDKETLTTNRARVQVMREFSARGFIMPPGFLAARRDFVNQEGRQRLGEVNRENTIQRIKIELENLWKAITQGTQLEQILIDHYDKVQDRALRAAIEAYTMGVKLYEAQIRKYEVDAMVFEIRAKVYDIIIRSLVSQIEVYKAELEAARLTVELDKARVEVYTAQIQALNVLSQVYKNRLDAARFTLEQNTQDITLYGEQLKGYDSYIRAQSADYDRFKIMLHGLETRAKVYETDISTYKARVEATKTIYEGQAVQMQVYQTDIDAYKARVQALAELLKTESIKADVYRVDVEAYTAEVNAFKVTVDAEIARLQVFTEQVKQYGIEAEVFKALLEAEKIKQEVYKIRMEAYGIEAEAYKTDVEAQVAEIEALIKRGELDVKVYQGDISSYDAESRALLGLAQADSVRRQGVAALTSAGNEQWKIRYDGFNTYEQIGALYARMRADIRMKEAELEIEIAKTNLLTSVEEAKIISSEVLGKAQVYSHIAASEMARFHFNFGNTIQSSLSEGVDINYSASKQCQQGISISGEYANQEPGSPGIP